MTQSTMTTAHTSVGRVLLVDDEPDQVALLSAMLTPLGIDVATASSAEEAEKVFARHPADVVVTDLNLPGASGIDLIRSLRKGENPPAVVLITGDVSVSSAVEALRLGATDYLQKPLDPMRLVTLLQEILRSDDVREVGEDEHLPSRPTVFEGMFGGSVRMREVFARIERVASTDAPVLIVGESGTGKELVARALHKRSRRNLGPFVPVHTGAIPKELVASELFGHEKGSFTGAHSSAEGKFEAATGGTIFLDEVGTMELSTQISLLRVLETLRFARVGASKERDADVRIVAATNRDLLDQVEAGRFREDLYYRLNVLTIAVPPLRERVEDIVPIAERFLRFFAKRYKSAASCLSDKAVERLLGHAWPGNVRELRNVMEQTAVFAQREIVNADEIQVVSTRLSPPRGHRDEGFATRDPNAQPSPVEASSARGPSSVTVVPGALPAEIDQSPSGAAPASANLGAAPASRTIAASPAVSSVETMGPVSSAPTTPAPAPRTLPPGTGEHPLVLRIPIGTPLAEAERLLIMRTLEVSDGNKQRAARILGISRRGLYTKLAAYGEHVPGEDTAAASEAVAPPTPDA